MPTTRAIVPAPTRGSLAPLAKPVSLLIVLLLVDALVALACLLR